MDRQIGLEESPDAHVEALVGVFREVWRVLRDDGCLWLNYGDAYAGGGRGGHGDAVGRPQGHGNDYVPSVKVNGLKPKDLIGLPWMVAFALRADGWYLRSAITLCKNNPLPESVTDRPTQATEMLFLLTKKPRYYYDCEAVREKHADSSMERAKHGWNPSSRNGDSKPPGESERWRVKELAYNPAGRNKRNWWVLNSQPLADAHFATFPEKLVEPCILAGTSEWGVCRECGSPWKRVVEKGEPVRIGGNTGVSVAHADGPMNRNGKGQWDEGHMPMVRPTRTTGWAKTCSCDTDETVPATVMDIFGGSGTVGRVATKLGRRSILIELNPSYGDIIARRNAQLGLGL